MPVALKERFAKEAKGRLETLDQEIEQEQQAVNERLSAKVEERDELRALLRRLEGPARTGRRGRRRGGRRRADEFVEMVRQNQGITVSEVAEKLDIHPNYLYRIKADLTKEGVLRTEGRKLFVTEEASTGEEETS